jgi:hypothetical protein
MTFNNYCEADIDLLKERWQELFKFLIFGREVGERGTPHLQMYGEIKNSMSCSAFKQALTRIFGGTFNTVHIEICNGSAEQNIAYCRKEGDYTELGEPGQQGKRNDLASAAKIIVETGGLDQVIRDMPDVFIKYSNGLSRYAALTLPKRNHMTIGYWLYGETGTGKSRWAAQNFPDAYWKPSDTTWFDGYLGQETVIIDDYRPTKEMSFQFILRLVDRYPLQVPVKGAYVQFAAKRIIFTSPRDIGETFQHLTFLTEDLNQMYRRFPHRLHFRVGTILPSVSLIEHEEVPDYDRGGGEEESKGPT